MIIHPSAKQPFVLRFWWSVEPVGTLFQALTVFDGHAPARRLTQALAFKGLQGARYTGAPNAKYQGKEFMCEDHLIAVEPVTCHEQPACQPFPNVAASVCHRRIVGLDNKGV